MRHAAVAYFVNGRPVHPDTVSLTPAGLRADRAPRALHRLLADPAWAAVLAVLHGGVNRAILSHALTGGRTFLGNLEQTPACINVLDVGEDWVVRAVNVTPYDLAHRGGRATTMEELWTEFRST